MKRQKRRSVFLKHPAPEDGRHWSMSAMCLLLPLILLGGLYFTRTFSFDTGPLCSFVVATIPIESADSIIIIGADGLQNVSGCFSAPNPNHSPREVELIIIAVALLIFPMAMYARLTSLRAARPAPIRQKRSLKYQCARPWDD